MSTDPLPQPSSPPPRADGRVDRGAVLAVIGGIMLVGGWTGAAALAAIPQWIADVGTGCAIVAGSLWVAGAIGLGIRRRARLGTDATLACPHCEYPLGGGESGRCSECGAEWTRAAVRAAWRSGDETTPTESSASSRDSVG